MRSVIVSILQCEPLPPLCCLICNRASGSVAAYPPNRRRRWIFESTARRRLKGRSSYRNRLASMSVLCMASLVAINGDRMLTGIAQWSAWLLPDTSVFRPSNVFLPNLPSCGSRCRQSPVNPLCPLGFRRRCVGTSRIAVIAPKASGFNIQAPPLWSSLDPDPRLFPVHDALPSFTACAPTKAQHGPGKSPGGVTTV